MTHTIYAVDDDRSVLKILRNIIKENNLGELVGTAECGRDAIEDINQLNPSIVLLDFLLPDLDGLDVIENISCSTPPLIIMISEVNSKEMIGKAYRAGIEFFINKPINVIEVVSVILKVKENINMKQVIVKFEDAFSHLHQAFPKESKTDDTEIQNKLKKLFGKLGILGETGCDDLIKAILWKTNNLKDQYRLFELYQAIVTDSNDQSQIYAVEQRIRRAITKAFNELSERGLEDYTDYTFERYGSLLFDFGEIRKQMLYLKGESKTFGKVNIRKFIEGVMIDIN